MLRSAGRPPLDACRQCPRKWVDIKRPNEPPATASPDTSTRIRKRRASPTSLDRDGLLKRICPSLRCSPPTTVPSLPLGTSQGAHATSPLQRLLKVRDTSGFLPSELLQVAGFVHARKDTLVFPPASVFPALAFTASLGHASTHEDAMSSPLLRPGSCPSLQGDVQSGDPTLVSPLIHFTPSPLSAFLHTWRDLPGVSPWILRTIKFGYTLQFAPPPHPVSKGFFLLFLLTVPARLLSCNRKSLLFCSKEQ